MISPCYNLEEKERETDRQTDRDRDRERHTHTEKVNKKLFFNAQSTVSVITGRNTIHLITSQSLFTVPDISQYLFAEDLEKTKQNEPGMQKLVG